MIIYMGISLNNKIITFSLLLLSMVIMPRAYSESGCNDGSINNTCVQVFVKSKAGQALVDMVVYLEPLNGQVLEQSSQEVIVGQFDKSFTPYISVNQSKSTVNFVNKDDITHHIYSAGSDNKFSFKIRAGETNTSTQFNHASEVAMGCNIHDWMSGYLLVVDTPYFGKTNEKGQVSFDVSKQGKYNIVVWHPQMQAKNNRMSIEKNIVAPSAFTLTLPEDISDTPVQKSDDDFDFLSDY